MSVIDHDTDARARPAPTKRRPLALRPAFALPALALAVALAGTAGTVVALRDDTPGATSDRIIEAAQFADPHAGTAVGLAQLTQRMSLVVSARGGKAPATPEQWVYIRSKDTDAFVSENANTGVKTPMQTVSHRQVWNSLDGHRGWLIATGVGQQRGGENLDSPYQAELGGPTSYNLLASLSTDPDTLRAQIYEATKEQGTGRDSAAFAEVGSLLCESYPPAKLYVTLFTVAAEIPGVVLVDDAVDAVGRHGVALALVDESDTRTELIFDRRDFTFLGEREVFTKDDLYTGFKAGTVTFSSAILERAFVDRMKQVPAHDN